MFNIVKVWIFDKIFIFKSCLVLMWVIFCFNSFGLVICFLVSFIIKFMFVINSLAFLVVKFYMKLFLLILESLVKSVVI